MKRAISAFLAPVFAGAFILSGCIMPAQAQTTSATVVAACGTPPSTYSAGANRALTQDTTGTLCASSGGGGGGGAVYGPNAVGAAAAHPPVIIGGTADATATGVVQVIKVDSSGNAYFTLPSIGTIGATAPTKADTFGWIDGSGNLQGVSASNPLPVSLASTPLPSGAATAANQATMIASLSTIATNSGSAIPAGTALIGKTGIDQTTPGTTNNVTVSTNVGTLPLVQATASVAISFTAAGGPTQIIAASGSTKIYVTHIHYVLSGAGTFALVTGTGTNCGTGTTYLEGASGHPLSYAANGGISAGGGLGPIYVTGAGGEICAITTGSVDTSGTISYAQF